VWSSLLTSRRDDKFDAFMNTIVTDFESNFDAGFLEWLDKTNDNWSTRDFLMAGPQGDKGGAPDP
jgi:hypothetical protein